MRPREIGGRAGVCGALAALSLTLGEPALGHAADLAMNTDLSGPYALRVMSWKELPFRRVVRQQYDFSCGSAALATLLHYQYGLRLDEAGVFKAMFAVGDQAKIRKVGFSMLDMKRYLGSIGLAADGYKVSLAKIAEAELPVIVVQQLGPYKHFVVIKGVHGGKVLVGDPASGARLYPVADFLKTWNGIAFVVDPGDRMGRLRAFDRVDDWGEFALMDYRTGLDAQASISEFTRNLPTTFQITLPTPALGGVR